MYRLLSSRTFHACAGLSAIALATFLCASEISAQQVTSAWNGVSTTAQAGRGETLYGATCAACHGRDLMGGDRAPAIGGAALAARWGGRPLGDLLDYIQTQMPL